MAVSTPAPENPSKTLAAKIYTPIGFRKGYNFVLWVIFAGAMVGCKFSAIVSFYSPQVFHSFLILR
jgi:LDH2 family malate/lactate/ureidoglycolate dehydrogenase